MFATSKDQSGNIIDITQIQSALTFDEEKASSNVN